MSRNWSRRRFIAAAVAGAVACPLARSAAARAAGKAGPLPAGARETLRAAMDAIVPAADGMPAAGEVGVLRYLEVLAGRDSDVSDRLRRAAKALERRAAPAPFASLKEAGRVRVLEALETKEPAVFEALRDLVYEGYYTRPEVWTLLGYETRPGRPGPGMPSFDAKAVERVRAMPATYRKAT